MSTHNIPLTSAEYLSFKEEITKRIRSAQYEALKAVNKEMITLYWEIGRRITEQQKALGWGKSVVENLSQDIQKEFPGIKDSAREICGIWHDFTLNIKRMKFCNHWSQKLAGQSISLF